MKLTISLVAAAIILKFSTPGPGSFFVFTVHPGGDGRAEIVAAGHETNACHVSFKIPAGKGIELYQTAFFPEE